MDAELRGETCCLSKSVHFCIHRFNQLYFQSRAGTPWIQKVDCVYHSTPLFYIRDVRTCRLWYLRGTLEPIPGGHRGRPYLPEMSTGTAPPIFQLSSQSYPRITCESGSPSQASLPSLTHLPKNHQVCYSVSPVSAERVGPWFYLIGVSCKYTEFFPDSLCSFRVESLSSTA